MSIIQIIDDLETKVLSHLAKEAKDDIKAHFGRLRTALERQNDSLQASPPKSTRTSTFGKMGVRKIAQ